MVLLKSIDGILNHRAFASWVLACSNFEAGQDRVIDEDLAESALFDVASTDDPKTAIQLVRSGRAPLVQIYPQPMTVAQAAAWLADLGI